MAMMATPKGENMAANDARPAAAIAVPSPRIAALACPAAPAILKLLAIFAMDDAAPEALCAIDAAVLAMEALNCVRLVLAASVPAFMPERIRPPIPAQVIALILL